MTEQEETEYEAGRAAARRGEQFDGGTKPVHWSRGYVAHNLIRAWKKATAR